MKHHSITMTLSLLAALVAMPALAEAPPRNQTAPTAIEWSAGRARPAQAQHELLRLVDATPPHHEDHGNGKAFGNGAALPAHGQSVAFSDRVEFVSAVGVTVNVIDPDRAGAVRLGNQVLLADVFYGGPPSSLIPSPQAVEQALGVKSAYQAQLFALEGVTGLGIGAGAMGEPVLEVYLAHESNRTRAAIPPRLEGLPTRVSVTGPFAAH